MAQTKRTARNPRCKARGKDRRCLKQGKGQHRGIRGKPLHTVEGNDGRREAERAKAKLTDEIDELPRDR